MVKVKRCGRMARNIWAFIHMGNKTVMEFGYGLTAVLTKETGNEGR